jgi:hypothetical protein
VDRVARSLSLAPLVCVFCVCCFSGQTHVAPLTAKDYCGSGTPFANYACYQNLCAGIVGIVITRDNDWILVIEEVSPFALFL